MADRVPSFNESQIDSLAKLFGDCGIPGSAISRILVENRIEDNSGESTKWKRLYWVFQTLQQQNNCANHVLTLIQSFFDPSRFIGKSNEFEDIRSKFNAILSFSGLEYEKDGKYRKCKIATTLDEAEQRLSIIKRKLNGRIIHSEVFKYCKIEYMQENYFHAVFEATKGLAQRIRELSGIDGDGAALIDKVFSIKSPILVFNTLQTETEQSEHIGFATLLKGCFGAIRNPLAHVPKILWDGEDDAADYMTLISLLHRKLDKCVKNPMKDIK